MKLILARLLPFICVALGVEHVNQATDLVNGWNGIAAALALDAFLHFLRTRKAAGLFWTMTRLLKKVAVWIAQGGLRRVSGYLFSLARFAESLANYSDKVIPQRLKELPQNPEASVGTDQKNP